METFINEYCSFDPVTQLTTCTKTTTISDGKTKEVFTEVITKGGKAAVDVPPIPTISRPKQASKLEAESALIYSLYQSRASSLKGLVIGITDAKGPRFTSFGGVDENSLFEIASITKVFTGLLLQKFCEESLVQLSDPIQMHLPKEVRAPTWQGRQITLEHLATHTSGLPRMPTNFAPKDPKNPYNDYDSQKLYSFLSSYKLTRPPGAAYEYSNLGYGLLAMILRHKTGKLYDELIKERIAGPLGMQSTAVALSAEQKQKLSPPFNAALKPTSNWDFKALAGCGSIKSTAADMLRFANANLDPTNPFFKSLSETHKVRQLSQMGLGWHHNEESVWHNGETGGYHSYLGISTQNQKAVIVLTNTQKSIDDIGITILNS